VPSAAPLARRLQDDAVTAQVAMELPDAPPAPDAQVTGLSTQSTGSTLMATMSLHNLVRGTPVVFIVGYLPPGQPDWSEPVGQSAFYTWPYDTATTPYTLPMYLPGCRTSGEYRLDVYAGGRRLATSTARPPASPLRLAQHLDVVGGLQLCRPEDWRFDGSTTGRADVTSPDGQRRLALRAVPLLDPPATDAGRQRLVERVLTHLSGQLAAGASRTGEAAQQFGTVPGTAWFLRLSDTVDGYLWASVGADGVLRAAYGSFPTGAPADLDEVLRRARFL
jgi:hypothetical protein